MLTKAVGSNFSEKFGSIRSYTVGPGATIFRGAIVALYLAGDNMGKLFPVTEDTSDTNKQLCVGIALEGGTAGGTVRVRKDAQFRFTFRGIATGTEGKLACMYSDDEVQLFNATSYASGTKYQVVGRIIQVVSVDKVFVDLADAPTRLANTSYD